MPDRRFRLFLIWNTVLTVLFLASLGANAYLARAATDPPLRVFTATADDTDINGATKPQVIDSVRSSKLITLPLNLSADHKHFCIGVASVTIKQPQDAGRYLLAIQWETGTYPAGSRRELTFDRRDDSNRNQEYEITTMFARDMGPGNHTLSLFGSKRSEETPNLKLETATFFAICMPPNPIPPPP
jgi:hypothetical protein